MVETSNSLSMKGWNPKTWLKRNKDSLKTLIALMIGLIGTAFGGNNVFLVALFGSASAAGTRIALDTFDYFVSEVSVN